MTARRLCLLRRLGLLAVLAALTAVAVPADGLAGNECVGVPRCISVPGPWVAVPARGGATYLLECPGRRGVVAGLDAQLTSQDIRLSFDGLVASPVSPGRSTTGYAFFRAVSGQGRAGAFEPRIGCIPSSSQRVDTSAFVTPLGSPLDYVAKTVVLRPGTVQTATLACARGESLVSSWDATMFATATPPPAVGGLAAAIHVVRSTRGGKVQVSITTATSVPPGAKAEVQVGAECATK